MRKLLIFLFLFVLLINAYAVVTGMSFVNSTTGFGFDLSKSYPIPTNGYNASGNYNQGYYTEENYVGKIISESVGSVVSVNFSASDLTFRSISDPTKYRSVDVYINFRGTGSTKPYFSWQTPSSSGDSNAYKSNSQGIRENTTTYIKLNPGNTTLYMPKTNRDYNQMNFIKNSTSYALDGYWLDISLTLPPITPEEEEHLGALNDYFLSVTCTFTVGEESQTLIYNFRGYYEEPIGGTGSGTSSVLLQVVPTEAGQKIDLKKSSINEQTEVADIYFTVYQTGSNTTTYYMFLSASNDPAASAGSFQFRLQGIQGGQASPSNAIAAKFVLQDSFNPDSPYTYDGTDNINTTKKLSISAQSIIGYQTKVYCYVADPNLSGSLQAGKYSCPVYVHVFTGD